MDWDRDLDLITLPHTTGNPLHATWRSMSHSPAGGFLILASLSLFPFFSASCHSFHPLFVPFRLPSFSLMTAKLHITIHHMAIFLIMSKNLQPLCKFQLFLRLVTIDTANAAPHSSAAHEASISC